MKLNLCIESTTPKPDELHAYGWLSKTAWFTLGKRGLRYQKGSHTAWVVPPASDWQPWGRHFQVQDIEFWSLIGQLEVRTWHISDSISHRTSSPSEMSTKGNKKNEFNRINNGQCIPEVGFASWLIHWIPGWLSCGNTAPIASKCHSSSHHLRLCGTLQPLAQWPWQDQTVGC